MSLRLHPDVGRVDFPALPRQFRLEAVRALKRLEEHPELGVTLHQTHVELDLTGYLAWRFGGMAYADAFRVIYRLQDGDIFVIAVASRQGSECYRVAQERLAPTPPRRRVRPRHDSGFVPGRSAA